MNASLLPSFVAVVVGFFVFTFLCLAFFYVSKPSFTNVPLLFMFLVWGQIVSPR